MMYWISVHRSILGISQNTLRLEWKWRQWTKEIDIARQFRSITNPSSLFRLSTFGSGWNTSNSCGSSFGICLQRHVNNSQFIKQLISYFKEFLNLGLMILTLKTATVVICYGDCGTQVGPWKWSIFMKNVQKWV